MPSRAGLLMEGIGGTPLARLVVAYRGRVHRVLLKDERGNPTGSVKDRTAAGLLLAMDRIAPLTPATVVVESTSGNLGLALARLLARLDCRLIAVVDPRISPVTRQELAAAGVELRCVEQPDGQGGYLLTRLRVARELCSAHPEYRWTDQYDNPANPQIHCQTTGPEIAVQAGPDLDAVYVAVSTGGTLAGVSAHLRSLRRPIRVVAVDAEGSLATGSRTRPRLITGIGASRRSSFLRLGSYDEAIRVSDADSFAMCRMLLQDTGLRFGGSTGSVLCACLRDLTRSRAPNLPVCLCADDGAKYRGTLYDDGWLERQSMLGAVEWSMRRFRSEGLTFDAGGA